MTRMAHLKNEFETSTSMPDMISRVDRLVGRIILRKFNLNGTC